MAKWLSLLVRVTGQSSMPFGNVIALSVLAMVGGWLGSKARIPGSIAVGAMLFAIIGNVAGDSLGLGRAVMPGWHKGAIQVMAGCLVGSSMTMERAKEIKAALLPVLANCFILLSVGLAATFFCRDFFRWDLVTSWLSTCPGRMADMIIYSGIVGADTATVVGAHVLRLVSVILFASAMLKIFAWLFRGRLAHEGEGPGTGEKAKSHEVRGVRPWREGQVPGRRGASGRGTRGGS
ncbi:MAG: AbrB family transcriptional regulator [Deltaproteobacteria bacterium]|jgi:membrane AbrB-like protein|nr:AbrB family transcriptional regulator [Deltaproteobacteria bacterium]